jgi:hypothetical protein
MKPTVVVFRRWPKEFSVIALFPEVEHSPGYCSSYMHVGQHSGADYRGIVAETKPVNLSQDKDAQALRQELESMGYKLTVRQRYMKRSA